jgi:hypothetical protein
MPAIPMSEKMVAWLFHLKNSVRLLSTKVNLFYALICKHSLIRVETFVAKIGGGQRLGNVAEGLYNQSKRAMTHGTCHSVGVAGHALHGAMDMILENGA